MSNFTVKRIINNAFPRPDTLLELVVSSDAVTLRTYREVAGVDPENGYTAERDQADLDTGKHHASELMPLLTGQKTPLVIRGEFLRADLAGRWFVEVGSTMVKRGWYEGAGENTDCGLWCFPIDYSGGVELPFNATTENVERKGTAKRAAASRRMHDAVLVFVPFADTPFDQCSILVRANAQLGVISNVPLTVDNSPLQEVSASMRPGIRLKSGGGDVVADGRADAVVEVFDPNTGNAVGNANAWLYLDHTAGYLPKQRVKLAADGTAKVSVMALGLDAGDSFKVKVGFKQFSGVLDIPFNVI